jgi:hypothetical protein
VVANAAFGRAAGGIVVDTIALKDLHLAIIQPDGDGDNITPRWFSESSVNGRIQVDAFGHLLKLLHSNVQGVIFIAHCFSPFLGFPQS